MAQKKRLLQMKSVYWPFALDAGLRLGLFFGWQAGWVANPVFWFAQVVLITGLVLGLEFQQDSKLTEKYGQYEAEFVGGWSFGLALLMTALAGYLAFGMYDLSTGLRWFFGGSMTVLYGLYAFLLWAASHLTFVADVTDIRQAEAAEAAETAKTEQAEAIKAEETAASLAEDDTPHQRLQQALAYRSQIESLLQQKRTPINQQRLSDIQRELDKAITAIRELSERVSVFQNNALLQTDFEAVPQAIADLEAQLEAETHPKTRRKLEETLSKRRQQLTALHRLKELMEQAEIDSEQMLSLVGTIYTQLILEESTNRSADYQHLNEDLTEKLHVLQDHVEALKEVKFNQ